MTEQKSALRKCVCTRCSDGYCGVLTTLREYRGYPMCAACGDGQHRKRAAA